MSYNFKRIFFHFQNHYFKKQQVKRGPNFDSHDDFFGENSNFGSSFDERPAIGLRSKSSDKMPARRKNPEIRSSIDFTDKKISSDVDLFSEGLGGSSKKRGDQDWRSSSSGPTNTGNGTTIQKEKTSAAFNFEGSKFHKSTTNGNDLENGIEPKVESWETAKGDADVKKSCENLRFGTDGDLQQHQHFDGFAPQSSRRSVPSLPKLSAPRSSRSGFSGMGSGSFSESDNFNIPSKEVLKAALQRTKSAIDGSQLDEFVDSLSRELKIISRQKRTFARSPKSYSFDCGESPFSDTNFRSKFEDDFDNDLDSTAFEATKDGQSKYKSVSETNDVTSETTEHKKSELRRQKTTEFSDTSLSNANTKAEAPLKRRLSTTRTRRSSEETSSSSTETQKYTTSSTSTKKKQKVNSGGDLTPDSIISCDGKKIVGIPAHIQTEESVEESSSMTSQREETKTSQVRTEEIEEVIATPIFETKDFLPTEWGATVYDVATQTPTPYLVDQFSQTGQNIKKSSEDLKLKESTNKLANFKSDSVENKNLKIKIPDTKLKTLKSKPLSAPCTATTTEEKITTHKKSTQNKENIVHNKSKSSSNGRLTNKLLDESETKSSMPFNRSFSSPGCMNTLSLADDIDCDAIDVCDKLPPHPTSASSRRSSLSKSEANVYLQPNDTSASSPTAMFERNVGIEIPIEFRRRTKVDKNTRPPLSTSSVEQSQSRPHKNHRLSRYKEIQMRNSSPDTTHSVKSTNSNLHHQPNDEIIIRKPNSSKAKRYRVKTADSYQEPRCGSPISDSRRYRSGTRVSMANSRSAEPADGKTTRTVPIELSRDLAQDFVDGTHARRSNRRSSANFEDRKKSSEASSDNFRRSSSLATSDSPSDPQHASFARRQSGSGGPSRPRSVTGNWKPQQQSYSPIMGESPSVLKTRNKVYKPREVYETDDYTFVICPKGSNRR